MLVIAGLLTILTGSWAQDDKKKEAPAGMNTTSEVATTTVPRVVATLDIKNHLAFVDPAHLDRAAALWHVENPAKAQWTIRLHNRKPVTVAVVRQSPNGLTAGVTSTIFANCKCDGNSPPHTEDVPCTQVTGGSFQIQQTVGYSYCVQRRTNDDCETEWVQVGDYDSYRDSACTVLVKTSPYMKSVCFP